MKIIIKIILLSFITISCSGLKTGTNQFAEMNIESGKKQEMAVSLTFQEYNAEEAMNFYVELFNNSQIIDIKRWGKEGPGKENTIMIASFELNGMKFICSDSPPVHNWTFTPAVAIYVDCESEAEIERLYSKFSENGTIAMPLDNYGFSQKFAWVIDRFGISWQLNLQ